MVSAFFTNIEFLKCIRCILLKVTYGKNGYRLWVGTTRRYIVEVVGQIYRDVIGKIFIKVSYTLYRLHNIFLWQQTIWYYTNSSIYWLLLWLITSIFFTGSWCFFGNFQVVQVILFVFLYLSLIKRYQYIL